jgi:hypothetical protein
MCKLAASAVPTQSLHAGPTTAITEPTHAGLLLSPSSEVIPQKLLNKIQSGKFLEMKELLQDNMALVAEV